HQPREAGPGEPQLDLVDPRPGAQMDQSLDVVAVVVGEHNFRDVVHGQAGRRHDRRKLLLAAHLKAGERDVAGGRRLAAVDGQQSPLVLDGPAVNWEWVRPGPGRNRSSCRRAPRLGNRNARRTRTLPVERAWIRNPALL